MTDALKTYTRLTREEFERLLDEYAALSGIAIHERLDVGERREATEKAAQARTAVIKAVFQ